jgi:hypothetical protein
MTTSNLQAVKVAIFEQLALRPGLADTTVVYKPKREFPDRCIYGGGLNATQNISAGRTGADTTRDENGTITIHVRVLLKGEDADVAEAAVVALGAEIEAYLAATDPAVLGLLNASITAFAVNSEYTDDAVVGYGSWTIQTESYYG